MKVTSCFYGGAETISSVDAQGGVWIKRNSDAVEFHVHCSSLTPDPRFENRDYLTEARKIIHDPDCKIVPTREHLAALYQEFETNIAGLSKLADDVLELMVARGFIDHLPTRAEFESLEAQVDQQAQDAIDQQLYDAGIGPCQREER